jgi:8-hydroxy-5-deazaflavin:NADPH oxidoreductase
MAGDTLTIAVLGGGNIGGTLGKKWSAAGHHVRFGVHNPQGEHAQALRTQLSTSTVIGTIEDALQGDPDVVLLALPGSIIATTIQTYATQLDGRILIDAANRMDGDTRHSLTSFQQHTPQAQIFRAFNSLGWENFENTYYNGIQGDLFFCGSDGKGRESVAQLITDAGLHPVYLGGTEQFGLLDSVATLWFALVSGQKRSRHLSFKVLEDN